MNLKSKSTRLFLLIFQFLLTAIVISFIFPSTPKFKYDFQKGKPWTESLLTAPFDFPIYKTDLEIQKEKASQLKDFAPCFKYNIYLRDSVIYEFNDYFQQNWLRLSIDSSMKSIYRSSIVGFLNDVYETGIFSSSEMNKYGNKSAVISIISNTKMTKVPVETIFSTQGAYNYILENLGRDDRLEKQILTRLNLNNFIEPNLIYDENNTVKLKKEIESNFSLYRGKVLAGQKIIDKGEIVNEETYNILNSLKFEYPEKMGNTTQRVYIYVGNLIIILLACGIIFFYLYSFQKNILASNRKIIFLLGNVVLTVFMARLTYTVSWIPIYALPFIIFPIVSRTVFDSRTATTIFVVVIILISSIVPSNSFNFIFIEIFSGLIAIYFLGRLSKRSDLFVVAGVVFVSCSLAYLGLELTQEGSMFIDWSPFLYFMINSVLLLFVYPLVFVYEKVFGFVSDVTLMELSDTNSKLLRRLSEEAPGTFQHCIQVSNLAQAAADAVDANPLLVRTGALYHDVGKLKNPIFFTENQGGFVSPHKDLSYIESARIIIKHIEDGVKIAEKNGLPEDVIDFIRMHHGTNKAMYFYTSFKNDFPEEKVDDELFTYPGPMPNTKETAILMMADSVEATSRSLTEYTDEIINEMVDRIVDGQLKAGCFYNTPLTFKDIKNIKDVFKDKLKTMYHTRVKYPKAKNIEN